MPRSTARPSAKPISELAEVEDLEHSLRGSRARLDAVTSQAKGVRAAPSTPASCRLLYEDAPRRKSARGDATSSLTSGGASVISPAPRATSSHFESPGLELRSPWRVDNAENEDESGRFQAVQGERQRPHPALEVRCPTQHDWEVA